MKILIIEGDIFNAITGFRKDLFLQLEKQHEVFLAGSIAYEWQNKELLLKNKKIFLLGKLGTGFFSSLFYLGKLFFVLNKIKPDVCLSFNVRPNFFLGLVSIFKNVITLGTITGTGFLFESHTFKTRLFHIIYRYVLSKFTKIFIQNQTDLDQMLSNGFKFKSLKVISGSGVDVERFKPSKINFSNLGSAKFLFISRLIRDKGFFEFIEAAIMAKKDYPLSEFFVIGSYYNSGFKNSEIDSSTIKNLQDEGVITYLGHKQDVIPYIENVDCVVLPSYREGMSNALMEAASLAKPIITTNVPGCKELVDDCKSGFLCQVKNSKDLAKKMKLFIDLPLEKRIDMGNFGREKMVTSFNRKGVIAEYLNFVSSLK